jgi:hypothetical protein
MKVIDAYILARTKRKTRRIRMALVTIASSLLFAVLFFAGFALSGVQHSAARFKDYGYNGRNLTQAYPAGQDSQFQTLEPAIHAQMDTELRARGVKVTDELRNNQEYFVEFARRMGQAVSDKLAQRQLAFEKSVRQNYAPSHVYHLNVVQALQQLTLSTPADSDPYLTDVEKQINTGAPSQGGYSSNQAPPSFFEVEPSMLTPLVQPGQTLGWKPGQPYPAVIPYAYAQQISKKSLVGLSSGQKIAVYQQLITDYTGKTLQYCYRNGTAQTQLESVLKYNHDALTDKDASTKPLDVTPCLGFDQAVLKKAGLLDAPADDGHKPLFPVVSAPGPVTQMITIKVVGFVPTMEYGPGGDIFSSFFSGVNTWPAQYPLLLPQTVVDQQPYLTEQPGGSQQLFGTGSLFFDFDTRAEQKQFVELAGCTGNACNKGDSWTLQPFGSVKTSLEGVFKTLANVVRWVALGIAILASILVMLTIGKLISDDRREIAVFRALGARQLDIAQIYFTYGVMLAGSALLAAFIFGVVGALAFSHYFAGRFDMALVQAVGAYQQPGHSTLVAVQPVWLLLTMLVLFAAAMLGVAVPVLLSRRRNLVTIMREE